MLTAINFDYETSSVATKISYKIPYRSLFAEVKAADFQSAEIGPQLLLRIGELLPELAGAVDRHLRTLPSPTARPG